MCVCVCATVDLARGGKKQQPEIDCVSVCVCFLAVEKENKTSNRLEELKRVLINNHSIECLRALKDTWQNTPPNWVGSDPCGEKWDGITCSDSRVISITLSSMDLSGKLSGDIGQLSELQTLDLSYNKRLTGSLTPAIRNLKKLSNLMLVGCGFNGPIPDTLGSLPELGFLALNSNGFSGPIPPSIGNLSKLYWLDLADNKLSGSIPVSDGVKPGLHLLVNTKHL